MASVLYNDHNLQSTNYLNNLSRHINICSYFCVTVIDALCSFISLSRCEPISSELIGLCVQSTYSLPRLLPLFSSLQCLTISFILIYDFLIWMK